MSCWLGACVTSSIFDQHSIMIPRLWCCVRKFSHQDDGSDVFPASSSLYRAKYHQRDKERHATRPKTSCENADSPMPQRSVRISRGSILQEQRSRDNADKDLCVDETQEGDSQTPTLSGEAIKEVGENVI